MNKNTVIKNTLVAGAAATLMACNSGTKQEEPIVVEPPVQENNAPVIESFSADKTQAFNGETITLSANATDADGDTLSYSFSPSETLECEEALTSASVTVTDGNGGSDTETIGITCNLNQDEVLSTILENSRASQGGVEINGQTPIATLDNGNNQRLAVFNHNSPINISGFNSNPDSTNSTSANVAHKLPLYTSSSDLAQDIASLVVNGTPLEIVKEGIVQDITCVDNANGLDCLITGSGFEIGSKVDSLTCDGEEIPLNGTEGNVSTFGYSTNEQIRANFNNGETTLENCVAKNGDLENLLNGSIRVTITEAQGPEINGTISSTITNEDGSIPEYALTSASITLEDGVTYMLTKTDNGGSSEANFNELHSVIDANEISYSVRAQDYNGNVSNESLGSYDVTQVTLSSDGGEFDGSSTEVTQGDDAQVYILAPTYSVGSNDSNKLSVGLEAKLNGLSSSNVRVDGDDVIVDTSDLDVGSYVISVDGIASCDTQQYTAQQCNSDFEERLTSGTYTINVVERQNSAPTLDMVNDFDGTESRYNTAYNSVTVDLTTPTCSDIDTGDTLSVNVYRNGTFVENVVPGSVTSFTYPEISNTLDTITATCFDSEEESSGAQKILRVITNF